MLRLPPFFARVASAARAFRTVICFPQTTDSGENTNKKNKKRLLLTFYEVLQQPQYDSPNLNNGRLRL